MKNLYSVVARDVINPVAPPAEFSAFWQGQNYISVKSDKPMSELEVCQKYDIKLSHISNAPFCAVKFIKRQPKLLVKYAGSFRFEQESYKGGFDGFVLRSLYRSQNKFLDLRDI